MAEPLFKYFIDPNGGDGWQSVFPADEDHKSRVHDDADEAFAYMHFQCGVPADKIRMVPVARLLHRGAQS
jgi:hypothetical protein